MACSSRPRRLGAALRRRHCHVVAQRDGQRIRVPRRERLGAVLHLRSRATRVPGAMGPQPPIREPGRRSRHGVATRRHASRPLGRAAAAPLPGQLAIRGLHVSPSRYPKIYADDRDRPSVVGDRPAKRPPDSLALSARVPWPPQSASATVRSVQLRPSRDAGPVPGMRRDSGRAVSTTTPSP